MIKPTSVLFACTNNAIRSPIAESLLKDYIGQKIYVDSAGVRKTEVDGFAIAVMQENNIDISNHISKSFDDLLDFYIDLVITLTPEAHHKAIELTRTNSFDVEFWPTPDPTGLKGNRETIIQAYRDVRDYLLAKIKKRF